MQTALANYNWQHMFEQMMGNLPTQPPHTTCICNRSPTCILEPICTQLAPMLKNNVGSQEACPTAGVANLEPWCTNCFDCNMNAVAAKHDLQGDLQCDTQCKTNTQTLQHTFPLQLGKLDNPNLCKATCRTHFANMWVHKCCCTVAAPALTTAMQDWPHLL